MSPEFSIASPSHWDGPANAAWTTANKPLALGFRLSESVVVTQLGWLNGSSASVNTDLGIYDSGWSRLVAVGGVAKSGALVWQWTDVANTTLVSGRTYYLVHVLAATTANNIVRLSGPSITVGPHKELMSVWESPTDSYPLPVSFSDMATPPTTLLQVPMVGMAAVGATV